MSESFSYAAPGVVLSARLTPWDAEVLGFPVAAVDRLELAGPADLAAGAALQAWLDDCGVNMASCRLPHGRMRESMFLEGLGFRFVEMVLHPHLAGLGGREAGDAGLAVAEAGEGDVDALAAIAESAFRHERFHMDPRLDPRLGDARYGRWVRNTPGHPRQRLLKVLDGERVVAFFIVEAQEEGGGVYWHLTAVDPRCQGQGYGERAWRAMLARHHGEGRASVSTTISARNVAVLNLYAKLGFRFLPPEMTFHWLRPAA